jgi:hypothetical protein
MGPPITYEADGKQFIALMGGLGRSMMAPAGPTNEKIETPPLLFVFEVDGKAPMPKAAAAPPPFELPPPSELHK